MILKPFKLHAVLRHRKRLKDEARDRFQRAQNQLKEAQLQLAEKEQEYENLVDTRAIKEEEGITIGEHLVFQNRLEHLFAEVSACKDLVLKKSESVVYERKNLIHRSQEEKVLEKLKERQNSEYRKFINKKEAAYLDEVSILNRSQQYST